MKNYSLNFSRPAGPILLQYYQFLRLGKQGYSQIMENLMSTSKYLEKKLTGHGKFESLSKKACIPIVVITTTKTTKADVYQISDALRRYGWMVPAYPLPKGAEKTHVLRIVIKETFSRDMADKFLENIDTILGQFDPQHKADKSLINKHDHHRKKTSFSKNRDGGNELIHPIC